MAEISGKRKARQMDDSHANEHDEPEIKAKKTNEHRRRSSFIRGNLKNINRLNSDEREFHLKSLTETNFNRQTTTAGAFENTWQFIKLRPK